MTWLARLVGRGERAAARAGADGAELPASGPQAAETSRPRGGAPTTLEAVERVVVPLEIAEKTQSHLRAAGRGGNEGLALWSGVQEGSTFAVTTLVTPPQRAIRSPEGICVVVDGDALHKVNVETFRRGERLLAQVHSHPGRAYHSPMDDRYAVVTSPGALSLVIPDFAVRPFDLGECAAFRLAKSGVWRQVHPGDVARLISVADS